MIGDHVSYVGSRFKLAGKLGIVISRVLNQPDEMIVDFGDDSFVIHESLLSRPQLSQTREKNSEPRKKRPENEPIIKEEKPKETKDLFISDERTDYAD
jgi:hypothetical protein